MLTNQKEKEFQNILAFYGELLEMPQKVCGGDILHVMAYTFVFEMPQNRTLFIFGDFPVLKLVTCFFLEMSHFFMFEDFEIPHISHFQN